MPDYARDFFISYTEADKEWAMRLGSWLERRGYSVIAQYADSPAGTHILRFMNTAVQISRWTIAVLSRDYLDSYYCDLEWQAAIRAEKESGLRKLIPVCIHEVDVGGSLIWQWGYIDLVDLVLEEAEETFVAEIGKVLKGGTLLSRPASYRHLILPDGPVKNDSFVGRRDVLEALRNRYFDDSGEPLPVARQILGGMSGTGKTQIAAEYAHRNADSYGTALFVAGGSREAVSSNYAKLAEPLGLACPPSITRVRHELGHIGRLLLIFDDVEESYLDGLLPRRGHVLVTTRSPTWTDATSIIEIGTFTRQESIELIVKRTGTSDHQNAGKFAADLGDLPVAVDSACRGALRRKAGPWPVCVRTWPSLQVW